MICTRVGVSSQGELCPSGALENDSELDDDESGRQAFTDSHVKNAARLIDAREPAAKVARDMGMSRATLYRRLRDVRRAEAAAAITD